MLNLATYIREAVAAIVFFSSVGIILIAGYISFTTDIIRW